MIKKSFIEEKFRYPVIPSMLRLAISTPWMDQEIIPKNKQEMADYIAWKYGWYIDPKYFIEFEFHDFGRKVAIEIRDKQLIVAIALQRVYALVKWYWSP